MADKNQQTVPDLEGSEPINPPRTADHPASVGDLKHEDQVADATTGKPHEPPVRSNRPDSELVQRLAVGAGQHQPTSVTQDDVDPQTGRFTPDAQQDASGDDPKAAKAARR